MGQPEVEILPVESTNDRGVSSPNGNLPIQMANVVRTTNVTINTDVQLLVLLESKVTEVLNDEVPDTPPAPSWYEFAGSASGLIASAFAPPVSNADFAGNVDAEGLWRMAVAGILIWLLTQAVNAHQRHKDLRRNKAAVISAIMRKFKAK